MNTVQIDISHLQDQSSNVKWRALHISHFVNSFLSSVAFHIGTNEYCAKQMTGFYMKHNTWLKWVKDFS